MSEKKKDTGVDGREIFGIGALGGTVKLSVDASRCDGGNGGINNLGMNFLSGSVVTLDIKRSQLRIDEQASHSGLQFFPLKRTSIDEYAYMEVPISLEEKIVNGMFDTGTAITAVDLGFIRSNPTMFELVSDDGNGNGITGQGFKVSIYKLKSLRIGSL